MKGSWLEDKYQQRHMTVTRQQQKQAHLLVNNQQIQRAKKFKYLRLLLLSTSDCDEEVKIRVGISKASFAKFKKYLPPGSAFKS